MSTLKAFLKDKNKEELLEDLKSIQKGLDSSESSKNKKKPTTDKKSQTKKGFFSFTKKK